MSEPDSGSDLASIRTRATRNGDGDWVVNGAKVWTSNAHHSHYAITLVRTSSADPANRHAGLSQLLVDLSLPGITINPIRILDGGHHFNEVVFDDVVVPGDMLLGTEGNGWQQVTAELAFERSGPERFLSTYPLVAEFGRRVAASGDLAQLATLGRLSAVSRDPETGILRAGVRAQNAVPVGAAAVQPRGILEEGPVQIARLLRRERLGIGAGVHQARLHSARHGRSGEEEQDRTLGHAPIIRRIGALMLWVGAGAVAREA